MNQCVATATRKVCYLAFCYSSGGRAGIKTRQKNLNMADKWGKRLAKQFGWAIIHPVHNTLYLETTISYEEIIQMDLAIISRVDLVIFLPGWQKSSGAKKELAYCKANNIPYKFWYEVLFEEGEPQ